MRLLLPLLLTACATTGMRERVATVEQRLSLLEEALGISPANAQAEQAAMALLEAAMAAIDANDTTNARALLEKLVAEHESTEAAQYGKRALDELRVIGKAVDTLVVTSWLQGETTLDKAPFTLLVFWEVWCPHCQREVPKLQAMPAAHEGLQVVGLTRLSRDTTVEQALAFAKEHGVTYPIAQEDGTMSGLFGVQGVPAAALLRGHEVIWRGHPATLDEATLKGLLGK